MRGVVFFAIVVAIVFALFHAALETPSGEGVPGPADWARHEQGQSTGP